MNARAEFTTESPANLNVRRVALALYGAEPEDRSWLMGEFSPEHRLVLEPMLSELEALGLPRDRAVIEDILRHATADGVASVEAARSTVEPEPYELALVDIRAADLEHLSAVLEKEPPALIASVLEHLQLDRRELCLQRLPAPLQRAVRTKSQFGRHALGSAGKTMRASKLKEALIHEVAARLRRHQPSIAPDWRAALHRLLRLNLKRGRAT